MPVLSSALQAGKAEMEEGDTVWLAGLLLTLVKNGCLRILSLCSLWIALSFRIQILIILELTICRLLYHV